MSPTVESLHAGPVADEDSRPYWEGLRRHEIAVQVCHSCGSHRCPPLPACHVCGSPRFRWTTASGKGFVYSWIKAHRPVGNLAASEVPAAFVTVEIEGACRLVGRCLASGTPLAIGQPVEPVFVDHADWTELAFVVAEGTA